MNDWLTFRLGSGFIDQYRGRSPRWGFPVSDHGDTLGEYAFLAHYSRRKEDGTRERFYECLDRVISGAYSIQKSHSQRYNLPWDEGVAQTSAQEAFERAWQGKWLPPGRGLWMCGTEFVHAKGDGSALNNCAYLSTENIGSMDDPSYPFHRAMDMLMLGIGVGFCTRGAGKLILHQPAGRFPHVIGDSREGWCESVGALLRAYFLGNRLPVFDYSRIRAAGSPILGFGGNASGPEPLRRLHEQITVQLSGREGQPLTSTDIVDLENKIGKCVVAGNVRRSAEVAFGMADDEAFLELKNWKVNPVRNGQDSWGHISNNSLLAETGGDYSHIAKRVALNGEPGLYFLDVAQNYGRLVDPPDRKDYRVQGANPCLEQTLENNEICCLVETFPTRCDNLEDYLRTLKFSFIYGKSVTLLPTRWSATNEIVMRNRRIGTSMSGVAEFVEQRGWVELRRWQDLGYQEVKRWDRLYSEWLGVRESIKCTTIKPSGTVSLLTGVTPGVHFPRERGFYVRTVRDMVGSPFALAMEEAGYPVEPSVADPTSTVVISLPVEGPDIRSESEVSIWEKVSLAVQSQRWWSDNSVSCTITFREDEADQIPAVLRAYDGQLKSISFLPMAEGTYAQAPYQRVTREAWEAMRSGLRPVNWNLLYDNPDGLEPQGERYCSNDSCDVLQSAA